jgi:hypothetical protein
MVSYSDLKQRGWLGPAEVAEMRTAIADAVAAERERCANLVPMNWCDPLLTGDDAPKGPLDNRGVEKLLRGIQDRIRAPITEQG